eukprot:Phypoly_transcript_19062.p1 GENE.Phypoly_transcript_19062~~Phypoly_transcript_19062.p1  ORF type:complete len:202 (+),score=29.60 Phypoly_transcript_19062:103-708(+)
MRSVLRTTPSLLNRVSGTRLPLLSQSIRTMVIAVGDKIPSGISVKVVEVTKEANGVDTCGIPKAATTDEIFGNKRVVMFGVPGAFTGTCSEKHLPGYVNLSGDLKKKGVDLIACIATNDHAVMAAWGKDRKVGNSVLMIADGNAELTEALGLSVDLTKNGMGKSRSRRYAMIVENGVVKHIGVEEPGKFEASTAEAMLSKL